ncbi:MAG: biotin--[acetyl-CoA-carboxylase] ligase [Bacteroidales bacterium]|nr:biotin--[acetyl-CoA-carboxylase] ligase [Bacteroidales bacterium]MBN2818215.1 biotin--[acetyl-CoA-carboxylase] ligase [Bacteroidales bacterium]
MNKWKIIQINECLSTNSLVKGMKKDGQLENKTAILAGYQTKGRGRGENSWFSDENKNLLCSIYTQTNIKVKEHFILSIITSLSIIDLLQEIKIKAKIKWPNDIYIHDKKVAGILIENSLLNDNIKDTVIGIGLNINQQEFPEHLPNPTSILLATQKEIEPVAILKRLLEILESYLNLNHEELHHDIYHTYNAALYRINEWHLFKTNEHFFNGRIHGVKPDGRLLVETDGGQMHQFDFGEIQFEI